MKKTSNTLASIAIFILIVGFLGIAENRLTEKYYKVEQKIEATDTTKVTTETDTMTVEGQEIDITNREQLLDQVDSVFAFIDKKTLNRYNKMFAKKTFDRKRFYYKRVYFNLFIEDGYTPLEAFILSEIPSVESSFTNGAKSSVGAGGQWQLMPSTARGYGIKVTKAKDERTDPIFAYVAGERYIRNLKKTAKGDIVRMLYGYNGGPGRALKGAKLPMETRHFAIKIYASILRFERNPQFKNNRDGSRFESYDYPL